MTHIIQPRAASSQPSHVAVFVPVNVVFPGSPSTVEELKACLRKLSRTDALIWCARLNLVVSNATCHDHVAKQAFGVKALFSPEEIARIERFLNDRANPASAFVFFRGQLLLLMHWIAANCKDLHDDGTTFNDPHTRRAFGKAALIVGELWGRDVYAGKLIAGDDATTNKLRSLGAFRLGTDSATTGLDPMFAIGRGRTMFVEYLPEIRPQATDDFLEASGFEMPQFYGLLAVIATHYLIRVDVDKSTAPRGGLFHENDFSQFPALAELFRKYVKFAAQSPDEMTVAAKARPEHGIELSEQSEWIAHIRHKPTLRTTDGRCIVLDPVMFAEHAAVGPLFTIVAGKSREISNRYFTNFGEVFERYVHARFRTMYPTPPAPLADRLLCNLVAKSHDHQKIQVADFGLYDGQDIALIEAKAVWLAEKYARSDSPEEYKTAIDAKYARFDGVNAPPKGVGQLARSIAQLANGKWKSSQIDISNYRIVYPVLLCYDPLIDAAAHSWYLAERFRTLLDPEQVFPNGEMLKNGVRVANLILFSIDELEHLETSVEAFGLFDLFRDYARANADRVTSLRNYLVNSRYRDKLYASRTLAASVLRALDAAKGLMTPS